MSFSRTLLVQCTNDSTKTKVEMIMMTMIMMTMTAALNIDWLSKRCKGCDRGHPATKKYIHVSKWWLNGSLVSTFYLTLTTRWKCWKDKWRTLSCKINELTSMLIKAFMHFLCTICVLTSKQSNFSIIGAVIAYYSISNIKNGLLTVSKCENRYN